MIAAVRTITWIFFHKYLYWYQNFFHQRTHTSCCCCFFFTIIQYILKFYIRPHIPSIFSTSIQYFCSSTSEHAYTKRRKCLRRPRTSRSKTTGSNREQHVVHIADMLASRLQDNNSLGGLKVTRSHKVTSYLLNKSDNGPRLSKRPCCLEHCKNMMTLCCLIIVGI